MSVNPSLSEQAAELIRGWTYRRNLNKSELARRLGVSHTWVTNRLAGHQEISLNELERIAAALDLEIGELLPQPARRGTMTPSSHVTVRPRSVRLLAEGCAGAPRVDISGTGDPADRRTANARAATARTPAAGRTIAWTHAGVSR